MKIKLENLILDKENPRFITPHDEDVLEEEIFQYLLEYEVLSELITGVQRAGFFEIGERPIVLKEEDSDRYIVLEGNRRICALKALHGFYSKKYEFDDDLKQRSLEVQVDIVSSREEIQPYLAARHIQGIKLWKPEARRNFYYKHYIDNKTLSYIEKITQQGQSEIKNFIKQSLFLSFFKKVSKYHTIKYPSIFYERIRRYFIEMKLISESDLPETYSDGIITINENILEEAEFAEFCAFIAEGVLGENRYINSRTIDKFHDFKDLLSSSSCNRDNPRLAELFEKILKKLHVSNFVPIQLIRNAVRDRVPEIKKIIDYSVIEETASIKIYSVEREMISETEFLNSQPGKFEIKIDDHSFKFEINDYLKPEIRVIKQPFKDIRVGVTEDMEKLISVFDIYGEKIDLNHPDVTILPKSDKLIITNKNNILVQEAGPFNLEIQYMCNKDPDYAVTEIVAIKGRLNEGTPLEQYKGYFDFKHIDVSSIIASVVTGKLVSELEICYEKKHLNVFASALRSVLELSLEDFIARARKVAPTSVWAKKSRFEAEKEFKKLKEQDLKNIAIKYYKKIGRLEGQNYQSLKNYLCANIYAVPTGHSLDSVINALHLGAHKSLKDLNVINILQIQPHLIAWLELIYILLEINFDS